MGCQFTTRPGVICSGASLEGLGNAELSFEQVTLMRPLYASISSVIAPSKRVHGSLFDLARASGPTIETDLRAVRIKGDGRCMFRALAQGLARNQGKFLGQAAEEQEADQLRLAVAEAICRTHARRRDFGDAMIAIEAEDSLPNYCKRILAPTFWGGEAELLVLSQMLKVPIFVYLPNSEAGRGIRGYTPIQKYGEKYTKSGKEWKKRRPVRLLYSSGNHYDLLLR